MEADAYKLGSLDAVLELGVTKESGWWRDRVANPVGNALNTHIVEPAAKFVGRRVMDNATRGAWSEAMARMRDPSWGPQTAEKLVHAAGKPIQAVGTAIKDTVAGRKAFPGAEQPADAMRQFRASLQSQGLTKKGSRIKVAYGKAVMPLLGAAVGAALAPEGERAQGAALGGLMLGAQSALFGRGKGTPAAAPQVAPKKSFAEVGHVALDEGKNSFKRWLDSPVTAHPELKNSAVPHHVDSMPRTPSMADTYAANQAAREAAARRSGIDPSLLTNLQEEFVRQGLNKKGSLEQFKLALDVGGSVPVPGLGGVGVSFKDQRERLPGMSRWVPRSTMERGFDYADQGFDPESVMDLEADRGSVTSPLSGAALAALGAMKFAPKSGVGGALLAGLGGAGLGSLYHKATSGTRAREGAEALEGAQRERDKFPIRRHAIQTANEATPLAVSRGSGDA